VNRAERLARLLRVLAAIISEPGLNPLELAEKAGVSERTLRRDLAQLRELGYEVAYTSGYEVQEQLNLEGRARKKPRAKADDALLQAVAHAVETAGLWRDTDGGTAAAPVARKRRRLPASKLPIVLIPSGERDADYLYAVGLPVETGLYVRFADGDDVVVASALEIDRVRLLSKVARKLSYAEAGYTNGDEYTALPRVAQRLLQERGVDTVRVSPRLHAAYLEGLRGLGLEVVIDPELFVAERRRKTPAEAEGIRKAQRAAEAAVKEVARHLAAADIRDGLLWTDGKPLTSEYLYARASLLLGELGHACPDMIIAGSPNNAMPHFRGEGQIRAGAPVIIDIFPVGRESQEHGDLTRTLVAGEVPDEIRRMHGATLQALDAAIETIRAGVPAGDVHNLACQILVDRGYGTTTKGYEGPDGVAKMNHSIGHGVGLDIHEEPGVRGPNRSPLEPGDVITVEPGLYKLDLGGVRIEDTGMVTDNGFENFTTLTRSLDPNDYL
jgi:Xaa-Pro aminopeptidase